MDQRYVQREPRAWTEHYLVLGWHRGVPAIARAIIATAGIAAPVVFVNVGDPEAVGKELDALKDSMATKDQMGHVLSAPTFLHISGSPADKEVLQAAGVSGAKALVIVADEAAGPVSGADDRTFRYIIAVRELNKDGTIVAEVIKPDRSSYIKNAGANEIEIRDTRQPFYIVAVSRAPGLGSAARQLFGAGSPQAVRKEVVPSELWNKTLRETREWFRTERAEMVIGIISDPESLSVNDVMGTGTGWVSSFIERMLAESGQDVLAEARGQRQVRINPKDDYRIGPRDSAIVIPTGRKTTAKAAIRGSTG